MRVLLVARQRPTAGTSFRRCMFAICTGAVLPREKKNDPQQPCCSAPPGSPFCAGCESKLEPIASKLQGAANRWVADVVERKMAYENSTHCRSLGGIARQYLQAGGFTDEAACPLPHRGDHASARLEGALAVSLETHASLSGEEAQVTWRRGGRGG
jgi:hypothetical protein